MNNIRANRSEVACMHLQRFDLYFVGVVFFALYTSAAITFFFVSIQQCCADTIVYSRTPHDSAQAHQGFEYLLTPDRHYSSGTKYPNKKITHGAYDAPYDITPFITMANPRAAAKAMREYAKQKGLLTKKRANTHSGPPNRVKQTEQRVFRAFNGEILSFYPASDINESQLKKTAISVGPNHEALLLIRFNNQSMLESVLEVMEAGFNIYNLGFVNTYLARGSLESIGLLNDILGIDGLTIITPQHRIGELSCSQEPISILIAPLDGDKDEYRKDLMQYGATNIFYDSTSKLYYASMLPHEARTLCMSRIWVGGISEMANSTPTGMPFEPRDSRDMVVSEHVAYNGNGVTVGVMDSGLDSIHPDLSAAILPGSDLSSTNRTHGTHVCGIISSRNRTTSSIFGPTEVKGVASGSSILYKDNGDSSAMSSFITSGIKISNHSYSHLNGTNSFYGYDSRTYPYDAYADNNDMFIVVAAGNNGDEGPATITSPGTAKNVVTVGSIQTWDSDSLTGIGARAQSSSIGPTFSSGRLKPDLVAPGVGIWSSASDPWILTLSSQTITGGFNNTIEPFEWPNDERLLLMSGTSMAAPHVAGVAAIIMEYAGEYLSSEELKAVLINTAIPLKGNDPSSYGGYANFEYGYGLVNAYDAVESMPSDTKYLLSITHCIQETNNAAPPPHQFIIPVETGVRKLSFSMAYNDDEGSILISTGLLNDNLDLEIISPNGQHIWPYQHIGAQAESPIEKAVINNPITGIWTARVWFVSSPAFGDYFGAIAEQWYALTVMAHYNLPELSLDLPSAPYLLAPSEPYILYPGVVNTGGGVAAGVAVKITGEPIFVANGGDASADYGNSEDNHFVRYAGSLPHKGATLYPNLPITAPSIEGDYKIWVEANAANRDVIGISNSITLKVLRFEVGDSYLAIDTMDGVTNWYGLSGIHPNGPLPPVITGAQVRIAAGDVKSTPGLARGPACDIMRICYRSYEDGKSPPGSWETVNLPFQMNSGIYPGWEDKWGHTNSVLDIGPFQPLTRVDLFFEGEGDMLQNNNNINSFTNRDDNGGIYYSFTIAEPDIKLTVLSPHGSPQPSTGIYSLHFGATVTCTVNSVDIQGGTKYVCTGWKGNGSIDDGLDSTAVFTLTNNSSISWIWSTSFWVQAESDGPGSVSGDIGWQASGSEAILVAAPESYYHFSEWTGAVTSIANPLHISINTPLEIWSSFRENIVTNGVPEWWLAQYGCTSNFHQAVTNDPDGDGLTSGQEWMADTLPNNSNSVLKLTTAFSSNNTVIIGWIGGQQAFQYLEYAVGSISTGSPWKILATNQPPTQTQCYFQHQYLTNMPVFYRLRAHR